MSFQWITPPSQLQEATRQHGKRVVGAVLAVSQNNATRAQNEMRQNASWTDRTGNARSGLFSEANMVGEAAIEIVFSHGHTIDYGIHLETGNAGKYAIIVPTLQKTVARLRADLQQLLK